MKKIFVEDNMYHQHFYMVYDCTEKELQNYINKTFQFEITVSANDGSRYWLEDKEKNENTFIIWLKNYSGKIKEESLLVHELFHQAMSVMDILGIKFKIDVSEEAFAYYLQHIHEQCLTELKSSNKKK